MAGSVLFRRLTAWAMLVLHGLVASGVPLPLMPQPAASPAARTIAGKDRSRQFPCMDTPCGCDSADRCFTECCCHSPAETLAWARARGLEPAVVAALARRVVAETPAADACCIARADPPTCCSAAGSAGCSAEPTAAGCPADERGPDEQLPEAGVVTLRAMLACGGIVAHWTAIGDCLPPSAPVVCDLPRPVIGSVAVVEDRISRAGEAPDPPPPRG